MNESLGLSGNQDGSSVELPTRSLHAAAVRSAAASSVLLQLRTVCAEACLVLSSRLGRERKLALVLCLGFMHLGTTRVSDLHTKTRT